MAYDQVVYKGECYKSLKSLAKHFGVPYHTLFARVKKGMSLEDAINKPLSKGGARRSKKVEFNGVVYDSQKSFCDAYNINYYEFFKLIKLGFSLEDIVNTQLSDYEGKYENIEFDGITYNSIKSLCAKRDVDYDMVRYRLMHGYSIDDAINEPIHYSDSNAGITYNGVTYESSAALCKDLNLSAGTFRQRIRRGVPVDIAVETASMCKGTKIIAFDKEYPSIIKFASTYNIPHTFVHRGLNKGLSPEEIVNSYNSKHRPISVDGKVYKSLNKASKDLGVWISSVRVLMNDFDLSVEDAILVCMLRKLNREHKNVMSFTFTIENGLLNCNCSKCNQHMLLTTQLAIDHLRNCIEEA